MKNVELTRFQDRLDDLFGRIGSLTDDLEMQAHWAKYLCILCSGFLETSVRAIYRQHVRACAAPHVVNFVETKLKAFQNPRMQKILELSEYVQRTSPVLDIIRNPVSVTVSLAN